MKLLSGSSEIRNRFFSPFFPAITDLKMSTIDGGHYHPLHHAGRAGRPDGYASNDVTLIAQAPIQPFVIGKSGGPVFNEMHFYDLPWPKAALEKIENGIVTMKVTLSYFVEPNLSGRAATRPETYRSFGLRFAIKKRADTKEQFKRRVSGQQEKDAPGPQQEGDFWLLGSNAVQAGSLHCDLWRGRAIDLALHDAIGVYPVTGWWKTHPGQKRFNDQGRYALVISISAPGHAVDMHSEISALVVAKVAATVTP